MVPTFESQILAITKLFFYATTVPNVTFGSFQPFPS